PEHRHTPRAPPPPRFRLSGLVPDHLTQSSCCARNSLQKYSGPDHPAQGRIIRHLPVAKSIVWPDHLTYGRIIRPRGLNGNPKPKLCGGGRIIRRWVGSSDQHRPSVLIKYVENCKKWEKCKISFVNF